MKKQTELEISNKLKKQFREEIKLNVKHKLDEINHYVAGCDSPFGYLAIAEVQEHLREIADILGINDQKFERKIKKEEEVPIKL